MGAGDINLLMFVRDGETSYLGSVAFLLPTSDAENIYRPNPVQNYGLLVSCCMHY